MNDNVTKICAESIDQITDKMDYQLFDIENKCQLQKRQRKLPNNGNYFERHCDCNMIQNKQELPFAITI